STGKIRQNVEFADDDTDINETLLPEASAMPEDSFLTHNLRVSTSRRVITKRSPQIKVFFKHHPLQLILDTGAEISMIKTSVAQSIGATINKSTQKALQADGVTPLSIAGETRLLVSRDNVELKLEALVVNDLDIDILAGIPFMTVNDISLRPSRQQILIGDSQVFYYGQSLSNSSVNRIRRTQAIVLRSPTTSVIWPGEFYEFNIPQELAPEGDCTLSIESRPDSTKNPKIWPQPQLIECIGGKVRIVNTMTEPQIVHKHEHFCQVRQTTQISTSPIDDQPYDASIRLTPSSSTYHSYPVKLDPDKILTKDMRTKFQNLLHRYDDVFNPQFTIYNGAFDHFEATINMGPTLPPQRKGKVPQYARDTLVELQQRFDALEAQGVFRRPAELGITAEYLNPSFLVKKPSGGFRLVTAFTDVGRYSKPQPSLMPDVDSTLRTIAQWKYIIQTDLTSAFYQIPLAKQSMKYCVRHLNGSANVPSDFASRNAPESNAPRCQICNFIVQTEDSVVRSVQELVDNMVRLPFTTRSSWLDIQSECDDLRRTHAHLKQCTRPSKKVTNVKDVKRYLSIASIAKDGLLVVPRNDPLLPTRELIIVPRSVLHGLLTALHLKLDHPSKHQLLLVMKRNFYALDMSNAIEVVTDSCHVCSSLKKFPESFVTQSSEDPPETFGMSFAADVLKQNRQLILVLRETVSSYTAASLIENEKHDTLRDALARLCIELHPIDGPSAVIRTDPAPGFVALKNDPMLQRLNISLDIGRVKNINKNPVAEKAISELHDELLRQQPGGGPVSHLELATAVARLNSRIRYAGVSAREIWTQRNQFTHEQLPISDREIIVQQHEKRLQNHPFSSSSKHTSNKILPSDQLAVGDLIYLYADRDKTRARSRYLVVSIDGEWCFIKKFVGTQLRSSSYKVKTSECYRVPNEKPLSVPLKYPVNSDSEDEVDNVCTRQNPPLPVNIPTILSQPAEFSMPVYPTVV
ncbi:MAG: hypothetical protein JAY74_08440, partial [Candidatus Thiodiazotropha taylori]|nr:hypothetical protein [Candidatus Thiodiazotropha taylori]